MTTPCAAIKTCRLWPVCGDQSGASGVGGEDRFVSALGCGLGLRVGNAWCPGRPSRAGRCSYKSHRHTRLLLGHSLYTVVDVQALKDFLQMVFDGERADVHDGADFVVGFALAHPLHDFQLPCR